MPLNEFQHGTIDIPDRGYGSKEKFFNRVWDDREELKAAWIALAKKAHSNKDRVAGLQPNTPMVDDLITIAAYAVSHSRDMPEWIKMDLVMGSLMIAFQFGFTAGREWNPLGL